MNRFVACASFVALQTVSLAAFADEPEPLPAPDAPAAPAPAPVVTTTPATAVPVDTGHAEPPKVRPVRQGVTFELGLGVAFTSLGNAPDEAAKDHVGLAPLSLALGGFLSRDVALSFRMTGTSAFRDRGFGLEQTVLGFYGPSLQVFLNDDVFVSGGVGLGLLALNPLLVERRSGEPDMKPRAGVAGNARIGWNVFTTKDVAFVTYAEATPAKVGDTTAIGFSLGLGFQAY